MFWIRSLIKRVKLKPIYKLGNLVEPNSNLRVHVQIRVFESSHEHIYEQIQKSSYRTWTRQCLRTNSQSSLSNSCLIQTIKLFTSKTQTQTRARISHYWIFYEPSLNNRASNLLYESRASLNPKFRNELSELVLFICTRKRRWTELTRELLKIQLEKARPVVSLWATINFSSSHDLVRYKLIV